MAIPCSTKPGFNYTVYPCDIDSSDQLPIVVDNQTPVKAEVVNRHRESIIAVESELGINPSGTYTTVRARLDALEGLVGQSSLRIEDEGIAVDTSAKVLNFIGADVLASQSSPGVVNIYIPPALFLSHWNTDDGINGAQIPFESISRTLTRISSPHTSEGDPFSTAGWSGMDRDTSIDTQVSFTTLDSVTGFGGNSTVQVRVYDANGTGLLGSFVTPPIVSDGPLIGNNISVVVENFQPNATRFSAKITVNVNISAIFLTNGRDGGRYHVEITHNTDTDTDGTGPYTYIQSDVFFDTNATTPEISSDVIVFEPTDVSDIITKHISGIEYYDLGSKFRVNINGIDHHNNNTSRINESVIINGDKYGLDELRQSPFGIGAEYFTGWNNNNNNTGVDYDRSDWAITKENYRYIGPGANASAIVRDAWNQNGPYLSEDSRILIDTFPVSATNTYEPFNDESRRQDMYFNGGTAAGNWDSESFLEAGEAIVFNSKMMVPNQTTFVRDDGPNSQNSDWTLFKPNLGGSNPNYTSLQAPVNYYRTFTDSSGLSRSSFTVIFTGSFVANATSDLQNSFFEIFIYKMAGLGNTGAPPNNLNSLKLHGLNYNFATFDDGVSNGQIRLASSVANTVQATFGGFNMSSGIFTHVRINNPLVQIDSITVVFN